MRTLVVNLYDERPSYRVPDAALERLASALPGGWRMRVVHSPADGRADGGAPSAEALAAVAGAEVYFGAGFPPALLDAAAAGGSDALRWVHSVTAGIGASLYPRMRQSPVLLTNSAGIYAEPMADTVLAMMLHFARGLDFAVRSQGQGRWDRDPFDAADSPVRELAGSTVGVVGYGGIGRAVARRALAFGTRVLALKRSASDFPTDGVEVLTGAEGLAALLERSDYVVLTVPETDATRGLMDRAALERVKPGAVLINVSRGGVLDEEALADALRRGRLRGAGLDVFQHEPLPPESPLWGHEDVLITPHVSGVSRRFWERQLELMLENLRRYLAGERLLNLVDKEAGY